MPRRLPLPPGAVELANGLYRRADGVLCQPESVDLPADAREKGVCSAWAGWRRRAPYFGEDAELLNAAWLDGWDACKRRGELPAHVGPSMGEITPPAPPRSRQRPADE